MKLVKLSVVFCALATTAHGQKLRHPNIILMMADDMGMGDTSAYQDFNGNHDSDQLHTPNMERLARMGVRFTDAHTAASRCSPSRYGLLTGRYPWRNRLKHWVLFGAQGDPMIEADRPTIATLLGDSGYHTGVVGKWHVGLRYRQTSGSRAAEFKDADLRMPLADTPLDHGFDFSRITSRSHGTSGPEPGRKNKPGQTIGPGHIHGRTAIGATDNGRQIASEGDTAYILKQLGGRHSDSAIEFLTKHVTNDEMKMDPVFLYYPSNSNHGPHTPDEHIGDQPVVGASRNMASAPTNKRGDYIYENDIALGRLMNWLEATDDPRNPGQRMIKNTIVIFTSDNGAEKNDDVATGPFRSHKGSCYEGGHRVPFIAAWPAGAVGDGNDQTPGRTSAQLLGLTDLFATFSDLLGVDLPDNANGEKGGEDSFSVLSALSGRSERSRPIFFNDHKEAKADHAVVVLRLDDPVINAESFPGQWKLFFDASLLRAGEINPVELYDLATDSREANNRVSETELQPLVAHLSEVALLHRTAGGHRLADSASMKRVTFRWQPESAGSASQAASDYEQFNLAETFRGSSAKAVTVDAGTVSMTIAGVPGNSTTDDVKFDTNKRGLGISSGQVRQVDDGESLIIHFDRDVIVESAAIVAGDGECGGYYQVGEHAPLAIYCIDGDIDANDQSGILSDIGVVKAGQTLRLDSSAHYGVETPGRWRLASLTVRLLK
ncbi:MAG: arylsulfatase [Fuerstiella sp.]|nr:arylsulfatase [Fuerstiella sp.]